MKRKQTTIFQCFPKFSPSTTTEEEPGQAAVLKVTENEPGATAKLPGCALCSATKSTGVLTEQRVSMSEEWVHFKIQSSDSSRSTSLASLRNKIRRHETSRAHKIAQELTEKGGQDLVGNLVRAVSETVFAETDSVFRTAYYLAKMNRPFTDHDSLIELQEKNGANMGTSLHSRAHSKRDAEKNSSQYSSKLSVLIDEATSISHKSAMIVNLKASVDGATPEFLFLELVELESQRAKDIEEALLNCLDTAGFTEEWLQKNWVSFVSDGASVMLGKNSGVATRLTARYPNLFTWHCMNHRLELAVSDAVDEVQAVNHFKVFLEKIHNLYSQSNKNSRELLEAAQEVGSQVLKIGRVLSTRWVASSFRSVKANFENAAGDQTRSSKERQTYRGLARRMQSKEFLCDLGLMFDALSELANLSQQLQAHSVTLLRADHLLKRTIRVLASFKDTQGEKLEEALTAQALGHLGSVPLESNAKLTPINAKQFLQSLINNLEKRLSFDGEMLHDLSVLDTGNWPSTPGIRHGEAQVKRLCRRFNLGEEQAVNGMRDFLEHPDSEPESLKPLIQCMKTIPCSTAECERGFSLMNNICTDKRSTLLLSNVSNLMMISINGPPVTLFEPRKYVTTWLRSHRSATQARRQCTPQMPEYKHIWKALYGNLQVPFNLQRLGSLPLPSMCKNNFKKRRYGGTPGGLPQVAIHKLPSTSASEHCLVHPLPHRNPTHQLCSLLLPTTTKPFTVNKSWTVERDDWFGNRGNSIQFVSLYSTEMQLYGNDCGIFMLMYALYTILDAPYDFTIIDMPALRKWWCVMLMENFDLGSHGKMFAHWTETSKALLQGEGPPVFRVRKLDDITERSNFSLIQLMSQLEKMWEKTMEAPTSKIVQDCKKAAEWVVAHKHLCTRVHLPDAVSMGEAQLREAVKL
ncbi:hypothetical protein F7725_007637 [Dissostichus mawsoni]|uniref:HAT C-terminal dimerisation domain-containing protein n=1 Tax=Dissostichus mawsoni TaxID=36200 RepID=A0A7J5Y4Y0_DISMA|nr:hypothetical protein F7725_007637 [Dissostichus mawsoni]